MIVKTENTNRSDGLRIGVIASLKRGVEQFIYRELSHLESRGAEVTLYSTKLGNGLYAPKASWNLVSWTYLGLLLAQPAAFLRSPLRYLKALSIALRHSALPDFLIAANACGSMHEQDVLYSTFGDRKFFVGYFGKLMTGKPLMCTSHAYEIYCNPNPGLFKRALAECDQFITISEYNRNQLFERFGFPKEKIEVIPCSIDLEDYRPAEKFVVLTVGYFVERKGHDILFQAVKKLNNPDIEIWVVGGEGAESDSVDVRALAKKHKIESQVAFMNKLSGTALRAMYHACDLFCLPCHFDSQGVGEGFPTVIIEAMACGKPVVSTRHVAIPEVLDQLLVEEKDVAGLADAIQTAYESETLRDELGRQNRELAVKHFAPTNVEKTTDVAWRLSGRRPNSGAAPARTTSIPIPVRPTP